MAAGKMEKTANLHGGFAVNRAFCHSNTEPHIPLAWMAAFTVPECIAMHGTHAAKVRAGC